MHPLGAPDAGNLYDATTPLRLETGEVVQRWHRQSGHPRKCLLLHGNPGSLLDWEPMLPALSQIADVAAIDLPGFGRSSRSGSGYEAICLDRLADAAVAVADALGWNEPCFVVGHSHGGGVAQCMAARHPNRVAGIVLLGTLGYPAHGAYRQLALPGAATLMRGVGWLLQWPALRPVLGWLFRGAFKDAFSPEPVSRTKLARDIEHFSSRPEVLVSMVHVALGKPCDQLLALAPRIRCPVLVLHGRDDRLGPLAGAERVHEHIRGSGGDSELEVIAGAGHMFIDFQAPEIVAKMAQFLDRTVPVI